MQHKKTPDPEALLESVREKERDLLMLQTFCMALSTIADKNALAKFIAERLKLKTASENFIICNTDSSEKDYSVFLHDIGSLKESKSLPLKGSFFESALHSAEPLSFKADFFTRKNTVPLFIEEGLKNGIREIIALPLHYHKNNPSVLVLFYKKPGTFSREVQRFVKGINFQLSLTVSNIIAFNNIKNNTVTNNFTPAESPAITNHNIIVGNSPQIEEIRQLVKTVAPTTSGVLLLGESGTGKEVLAQAIHLNSECKHLEMVKVNCAALPENLIESELFGHEKGSFTGAVYKKTGKFKIADNSTLFLDEIGELPLQLQTKLLRVLQENEFEAIGSNKTTRVNVRIIAATNRNLLEEVAAGRFRADLFYRLNVFPILLPPLRDRKEDILPLSNYFIAQYCSKNKLKHLVLSTKVQEAMLLYNWPGNIRELKHILERCILLATTNTITQIQFPEIKTANLPNESNYEIRPLYEIEKEYILRAIKLCNGRISGPNGAAVRLGLPHTTLISRMQKLGISKSYTFKNE